MEQMSVKSESLSDTRLRNGTAHLVEIISELVSETHPNRHFMVTLDSDFERDLGLDSLARAELILRIDHDFGVSLPTRALNEAKTPRDLLQLLTEAATVSTQAWQEFLPLSEENIAGVPLQAKTIIEVLNWHVQQHPDRLHVLLYNDSEELEQLSYAALHKESQSIAAGLIAHSLQPKQTVALMLPTSRDYLASFFGVLLAGGIPVPIYPPARPSQIEDHLKRHARILNNAESVYLITIPQAKPVAAMLQRSVPSLCEIVTPHDLRKTPQSIVHHATASDIAFLQYTSGSTGDPKGVILTHANLLTNLRSMGEVAQVTNQDVFVSWLPLYHDMGLIGAWFGSLYFGFPLVLMSPLAFLARPVRWLQAIHRHRGTISAAPNFAYELVSRKLRDEDLAGLDLSSWRIAFNGAEPVSPATLEVFASHFAPYGLKKEIITPSYGLAECSVGLAFPPLGRGPKIDRISREAFVSDRIAEVVTEKTMDIMRIPACGRAIPSHAMRVIDEQDMELPDRHVGRLQFKGPSATQGYYRNPEATRKLISGDWRETGDYAYLVDGEVYLTGRVKDLIIRGGRNIYPYEMEEAVGKIPGIRKGCVAVFGSMDMTSGTERLVILAETKEADEKNRERLRIRINEVSSDIIGTPPDDIVLAPPYTVLKTSSGKIRRAASREVYEQGLIGKPGLPMWKQMIRLLVNDLRSRMVGTLHRIKAKAYGSYVWFVFIMVAMPVWLAVSILQRPPIAYYLLHYAARLLLFLAGIRFQPSIQKQIPESPHLLVVNHGSYMDGIILMAGLPPHKVYAFAAKRELENKWFTRFFLKGMGVLFVERFDARLGVESVDQLISILNAGRSVLVFPEGTFSSETGVRPFRMGAFVAAVRAGIPIVTAGLRGVRAMLRDKTWMPRHGHPDLKIGSAFTPRSGEWSEAARLRDAARAEIIDLSGEPDLLHK
jgi:acyl carrier protein